MNLTQQAFDKLVNKIVELEKRLELVEGKKRKPNLKGKELACYNKLFYWLKGINVMDYELKANEYWNTYVYESIDRALKDSMTTSEFNFRKCCNYWEKKNKAKKR